MPLRTRKKEDDLSLDVARSLLSYDPETGALDWKKPPRRGAARRDTEIKHFGEFSPLHGEC